MAKQGDYTRGGRAVTALILEVFRLNGHLLTAGDRLTQEIGLTSARWQVLGAIALAGAPQPVANLARTMGLTRQAVQRTANELSAAGLVEFAPNPHHQRAKLVVLTRKGHNTSPPDPMVERSCGAPGSEGSRLRRSVAPCAQRAIGLRLSDGPRAA